MGGGHRAEPSGSIWSHLMATFPSYRQATDPHSRPPFLPGKAVTPSFTRAGVNDTGFKCGPLGQILMDIEAFDGMEF